MTQLWLNYYANLHTKRCLNVIVNSRHNKNDPNTKMLQDKYGYTIVWDRPNVSRQDTSISMAIGGDPTTVW